MVLFAAAYHQGVRLLAKTPLKQVAQRARNGQPCVLTFHGLRRDDDEGVLDANLHTKESVFREICTHLADQYEVMPLSEIIRALRLQRTLPQGALAITFDDGYRSNLAIAGPILADCGLPATVFVTSGFVDRTVNLWFHRLEMALAKTELAAADVRVGDEIVQISMVTPAARRRSLSALQFALKSLPQEQLYAAVEEIEQSVHVSPKESEMPDIFEPLSWNDIYHMSRDGVFEFGAHTHEHLILGRCSRETARREIHLSRDKLAEATGVTPTLFAYPNGQPGDYTTESAELLHEAGFVASMTMSPGFINRADYLYALPRYGAPESLDEAEATVSGTYETLKEWRSSLTLSRSTPK
jgi:peptidoglycan/xylan/chitin deacetylase (PgdA/CDA1 family)